MCCFPDLSQTCFRGSRGIIIKIKGKTSIKLHKNAKCFEKLSISKNYFWFPVFFQLFFNDQCTGGSIWETTNHWSPAKCKKVVKHLPDHHHQWAQMSNSSQYSSWQLAGISHDRNWACDCGICQTGASETYKDNLSSSMKVHIIFVIISSSNKFEIPLHISSPAVAHSTRVGDLHINSSDCIQIILCKIPINIDRLLAAWLAAQAFSQAVRVFAS